MFPNHFFSAIGMMQIGPPIFESAANFIAVSLNLDLSVLITSHTETD